ncbi:MAG: tellurite resistance TerB family protein [Planctomycetota bacterium]
MAKSSSPLDMLGSLLEGGMSKSSKGRVESSLGSDGLGGLGSILEQMMPGAGGGEAVGGAAAGAAKGASGARARSAGGASGGAGNRNAGAADIGGMIGKVIAMIAGNKTLSIGALAGALLGGGGKSVTGGMGGAALALLGSLAFKALGLGGGGGAKKVSKLAGLDDINPLTAGLRAPETEEEQQQVAAVADLIVRAMVNAAKADGEVDESELARITGKLASDGLSGADQEALAAQLHGPMETDAIVAEVSSIQVAAQVYAASVMAIDVDTPAEREYLASLAQKLQLDADVVADLHHSVGLQ